MRDGIFEAVTSQKLKDIMADLSSTCFFVTCFLGFVSLWNYVEFRITILPVIGQ